MNALAKITHWVAAVLAVSATAYATFHLAHVLAGYLPNDFTAIVVGLVYGLAESCLFLFVLVRTVPKQNKFAFSLCVLFVVAVLLQAWANHEVTYSGDTQEFTTATCFYVVKCYMANYMGMFLPGYVEMMRTMNKKIKSPRRPSQADGGQS